MKAINEQYSSAACFKKFSTFLDHNNLRKTPERLAILNCILKINSLFTVDQLFQLIDETDYHVSRATLYNTIELLSKCGIIRRHVFEGLPPQYERISASPRSFAICSNCGRIKDIRDNNFIAFMNAHKKITAFTMSHYSLYIYGICNTCARKLKRSNNANMKKTK